STRRELAVPGLKRAVRVSMQEQYFAILTEHRPPAAHSRHGVIDLEFAENRIPTIRRHFLLDCFHTIRIEVVPAEREAVLVVLARTAELHRDHDRVVRNLRLRPTYGVRIDRFAFGKV